MKFQIADLVDPKQLDMLMASLHKVTGIPYGLIDTEGNILLDVGHRDICTKFHRAHPTSLARCIASDRDVIANAWNGPHYCPRCPHGFVCCATPLIVEGERLACIFMGQLLSEPPDVAFFQQQAETYGFDVPSYMHALNDVPVLPRDEIIDALELLQQIAYTLASNGINQLRQLEVANDLRATKQQLEDHSERLALLTQRSLDLQEAEQRRLARELHDTVSSNLSLIGIELSDVQERLSELDLDAIADKLSDCGTLLQDTLRSTREISADLHPAILDIAGLIPALETLSATFQKQTNVTVDVIGQEGMTMLPKDEAIVLFRIAQEALVNCAKHSHCTTVSIHLDGDSEQTQLSIMDNGIGFSPPEIGQTHRHAGLGLLSMRERAAAIGASCFVESVPGEGTRLRVLVPHACDPGF